MNMIQMQHTEDAAQAAWKQSWAAESDANARHPEQCPSISKNFLRGFLAGVREAGCQSKGGGCSHGGGSMSHYPAAVEEPEEEA